MANLEEGLHGGVNGKLGNIVYQTNHGNGEMEIVARSKATRSSPDDPKMKEQREKIKVAHAEWEKLAQGVRDRAKRASWQGETARTKYIRTVNPYIDDQGNLERQPDWILKIRREIKEDPNEILNGDLITSFEEDNYKEFWEGGTVLKRYSDIVFSGNYALGDADKDPSHFVSDDDNKAVYDRYPQPGEELRFKIYFPEYAGGSKWVGWGVKSDLTRILFSFDPSNSTYGINIAGGGKDVLNENIPREEWIEGRMQIQPDGGDWYRAQFFGGENFDSPILSRWTEIEEGSDRPPSLNVFLNTNFGVRLDQLTAVEI